jgi:hypothetical protein
MFSDDSLRQSLVEATEQDIDSYRKWLGKSTLDQFNSSHLPGCSVFKGMPVSTTMLSFFSTSNARNWVSLDRYRDYLLEMSGQVPKKLANLFEKLIDTTYLAHI